MKAIKIIQYVFALIGIGLLIGAFFIYENTDAFLKDSIATEGTVVELLTSRSSSDNGIMYKPLVQFVDKEGNLIEFSSSTSSNPPSYSVGEKVEVLYDAASPHKAKIKGVFSLWGTAIIVGGIGLVFFAIGGVVLMLDIRKNNNKAYLRRYGTKITTDIQGIGINASYKINGRSPYKITSQWQNPATSKIHVFTSDNIWFDPTNYINSDTITVIIDKNNPKKYMVDLSFLPEVAE